MTERERTVTEAVQSAPGRSDEPRRRPRDLGLALGRLEPGPLNAITDVDGVKVGHVTLFAGEGPLVPGQGPVRTGVTAILPHDGNLFRDKVEAAVHIVNGFGKTCGIPQVQELGTLETPVLLTNTLNVGLAADALVTYMIRQNPEIGIQTGTVNPFVGECNDGYLNDIQGRHVRPEHVWAAIAGAAAGPVEEGAVGAGTGMSAFEFKGGIGTASRRMPAAAGGFTVGALVLANFGRRAELEVAGVPVGRELLHWQPEPAPIGRDTPPGSIIIVLATDAPLDHRQLGRLARRAAIGLARTGSRAANGSGDFVLAFSTSRRTPQASDRPVRQVLQFVDDDRFAGPLFWAAIEATEEAVLNAVFMAPTVVGRDGNISPGLPPDLTEQILRRHGRL
ncbi:MAG: DmpA family aminopeptidase [Symbiobacteriia bacterium]